MNAISFGKSACKPFGAASGEPKPDASAASSVDMAWLVLEAANDLGDHAAVEACRRVIDASLNGTAAPSSDVNLVVDYFR
jgi:hypothetical protein